MLRIRSFMEFIAIPGNYLRNPQQLLHGILSNLLLTFLTRESNIMKASLEIELQQFFNVNRGLNRDSLCYFSRSSATFHTETHFDDSCRDLVLRYEKPRYFALSDNRKGRSRLLSR